MAKHKVNSDKVHKGMGIDGDKGENFTRQHNCDPWNPPELTDGLSDGKGKYTSNDVSFLNRKASDTPRNDPAAKAREIWQEVEDQSPDDLNRAIKSRGGFA